MAFGWIDEQAQVRRRAGLVRTLRPRPADSALLDLASNDYLGLAHHPEVTEGAARAARTWGGGSTGSRLVTDAGNHASLIDGCRLARGERQVVGHADPEAVRKALATHRGPAIVV